MKVLVVDDCPEDRALFRRFLESSEPRTLIRDAETFVEAQRLFRDDLPDCVLIDYNLPDADGMDVAGALREQGGGRPVAYVMVTGQGSEDVAANSFRSGFDDYIVKDAVTPDALRLSVTGAVERARARSDQLRSLEDLESFAAVTAHDLRAPLQAIKGFAELGLTAMDRGNLDRVAEYLNSILDGCVSLESLIEALLAYARAGEGAAAGWPVDANKVVVQVVNRLAANIQERGARLSIDPLPRVSGDATALGQVLQNLIDNGLRHAHAAQPRVAVSARMDGDWAEFSVADNGRGIAPADRRLVFLPLVRLAGGQGHGLGLAICQRQVERLGGRIWVQEAPGGGADFRFRVPLWREPENS